MVRKWFSYSLIILLVLTIAPAAFAQEDGNEEGEGSYFCENRDDDEHPVAAGIAETYEIEYQTVIAWFCGDNIDKDGENFGFGEIMLALQTSELEDDEITAEEILDRRAGGEGWGEIWQDLGLIGKPDHAGPPEWVGDGPPEWAGPPEGVGPPWLNIDVKGDELDEAEEPDEARPFSVLGRPPWAGPPAGVGRP
jgi:hypothetical protein